MQPSPHGKPLLLSLHRYTSTQSQTTAVFAQDFLLAQGWKLFLFRRQQAKNDTDYYHNLLNLVLIHRFA
jgi:hypothetical protein